MIHTTKTPMNKTSEWVNNSNFSNNSNKAYRKSGTWDLGLGTWDPQTWDTLPGIRDPGPYMWDTWEQSKKYHFVYLAQVGYIYIYIYIIYIYIYIYIPFYHFLFSRYLDLTGRHFSSDILVPFPNLSNFYIEYT